MGVYISAEPELWFRHGDNAIFLAGLAAYTSGYHHQDYHAATNSQPPTAQVYHI